VITQEQIAAIKKAVSDVLEELPPAVILVAAAKTRTSEEVLAAIEAGVTHVGHNYVQEAEKMRVLIGDRVQWHFIGHLQKNKAKKAVRLFDMIETVDSLDLARILDRECAAIGKILPVLIEINSGREPSKSGVLPEELDDLVRALSPLPHIRVQGLMTMGPLFGDPEHARPYFIETRRAFDRMAALQIPNMEMRHLSMGMSNSYKVALEEGANMIRIGTRLFGPRSELM
jgi:pyridoxal phosphate enzyme (YggS family)